MTAPEIPDPRVAAFLRWLHFHCGRGHAADWRASPWWHLIAIEGRR